MTQPLTNLISDILCGGEHFISGVQRSSDTSSLLSAIVHWAQVLQRDLGEIIAVVEPCLRQSILMSLIPAQAVDPSYQGSIDKAIDTHIKLLGLTLQHEELIVIRDICINVRRMQGLNRDTARRMSATIATLRGDRKLYLEVLNRQNKRCVWCGVELDAPGVKQTLEHVTPKHLGDDPVDGKNWAIACASCNFGKAHNLAWAASAQAHDYVSRSDFDSIKQLSLLHRWAVLMRTRKCIKCESLPLNTELWVYRRISTGLPIPANCSITCVSCAKIYSLEVLVPKWDPSEARGPLIL